MKRQAGKLRRVRLIQEGLDQNGKTFMDVADALDVSYALVSRTAHGKNNNRRVLRHFLGLGIDPAVLDLPEDLRTETNTAEGVA
jgi:hypothetical protein